MWFFPFIAGTCHRDGAASARNEGARQRQPAPPLHSGTALGHDLGVDPLDLVDSILKLERPFQLTISDEVPLCTVDNLVHCVTHHRGEAAAA